jgi:hypothetical protein
VQEKNAQRLIITAQVAALGMVEKRFVRGDIDGNTEGKIMTKKMDRMKFLSKKERNVEFYISIPYPWERDRLAQKDAQKRTHICASRPPTVASKVLRTTLPYLHM